MKKQFYRVKQLADQTFSSNRSGKSETLTDELQAADRKVENLRSALQAVCKKFTIGTTSLQGQDQAAREKRLRKLPEYLLGQSMCEASNFDDDDSILKYILFECGKTEKFLANEIAEHELKVEQLVSNPLNMINDQELPQIMKTKKHLNRLISEKDSAASRYHYLLKQMESNPSKLNAAKEELEEAGAKVEQCRDSLAAEMFALVAKEAQLAHTLLQYVKLQRAYHESALHSLQGTVPILEEFINERSMKPMFGFPLEDHLKMSGRAVAFPIELCVCVLNEVALNEEGLFRIVGGASKVRRMKLSLDSGMFSVPLPTEYRDPHVVASVLKSYLRELPEPMLTHRLRSYFVESSRLPPSARLVAINETIKKLPEQNYRNLRYLVSFLAALTKNRAKNRMTPTNLAIVLAPNLLWSNDDSYDMSTTAAANVAVEMLIEHADKFFDLDTDFYLTFSKEDLLPDLCDGGFSVLASGEPVTRAGRHTRSNSHDANVILLENDVKRAQSNSSLSDQSSPPHGSPKPIIRRKNKPLAPVPPVPLFVDKAKSTTDVSVSTNKEHNADKPNKPPRPVFNECVKVTSGTQTVDRVVHKKNSIGKNNQKAKDDSETLELRRRSFEGDSTKINSELIGKGDCLMAKSLCNPPQLHLNTVENSTSETLIEKEQIIHTKQTNENKLDEFLDQQIDTDEKCEAIKDVVETNDVFKHSDQIKDKSIKRPIAAPRVSLPKAEGEDVQVRRVENGTSAKPAIPERPPTLRPQSFRGPLASCDSDGEGKPRLGIKVLPLHDSDTESLKPHRPAPPISDSIQKTDVVRSVDNAEEENRDNVMLSREKLPSDSDSESKIKQRSSHGDNEAENRHRPVRPAIPPPPVPTALAESTDL